VLGRAAAAAAASPRRGFVAARRRRRRRGPGAGGYRAPGGAAALALGFVRLRFLERDVKAGSRFGRERQTMGFHVGDTASTRRGVAHLRRGVDALRSRGVDALRSRAAGGVFAGAARGRGAGGARSRRGVRGVGGVRRASKALRVRGVGGVDRARRLRAGDLRSDAGRRGAGDTPACQRSSLLEAGARRRSSVLGVASRRTMGSGFIGGVGAAAAECRGESEDLQVRAIARMLFTAESRVLWNNCLPISCRECRSSDVGIRDVSHLQARAAARR